MKQIMYISYNDQTKLWELRNGHLVSETFGSRLEAYEALRDAHESANEGDGGCLMCSG